MTDEAAVAILAAVGLDPAGDVTADGGRLQTTEGNREVTCTVAVVAETPIDLMAGTTDLDRDSFAADTTGGRFELVEGQAEGLDPDTVFGAASDSGVVMAVWVDGGFWLAVIMSTSSDDVFEALPVAVEAAATALR